MSARCREFAAACFEYKLPELSGQDGPRAAADALVNIKTKKMKSWAPPNHIRKEFGGVIRPYEL